MDDAEVLPVELLMHPPYHIFYVKAFFYWLDYDITEMRILLALSISNHAPNAKH